MSDFKACKDCKHCVPEWSGVWPFRTINSFLSMCKRGAPERFDYVTGEKIPNTYLDRCEFARTYGTNSCGHEARFFEPRA